MTKILAEIIAGVIPFKIARNRWRGILRYGLINAIITKYRIKKCKTKPHCNLSVCAIAKNEGPYFKEWLDWHLNMGVEKFYIYDNDSSDNTKSILEPYIFRGIVEYHKWSGYRQQLAAYDHCIQKHRFSDRWIAFIDLDEFIVPIKDKSIPDFLKRFEDFAAIEINWLTYGSAGNIDKYPDPVMSRFKFHSQSEHPLNRHVKSIINPRKIFNMIGCHEAARISGKSADSHGLPIKKNFRDRVPQHDIIRINHYAVKSREEFIEKLSKGRASGRQRVIGWEYFNKYDLNDIEEKQI